MPESSVSYAVLRLGSTGANINQREKGEGMSDTSTENKIDTSNDFFLGAQGEDLVFLRSPQRMNKGQAMRLAAWIVAMGDNSEDHKDFKQVLAAVEAI